MSITGNCRRRVYGYLSNTTGYLSCLWVIRVIVSDPFLLVPAARMTPTEMGCDNPTGNNMLELREKTESTL